MIYTCERCNKQFSQKIHYTNHLNRIRPCKSNINIDSLNIDNKDKLAEISKTVDNLAELAEKYSKNANSCTYCLKNFFRKYELNRHINNNTCKVKKIMDEQNEKKDQMFELLKEQMKDMLQIQANEHHTEIEKSHKKIEELNKTILDLQSKWTKNINNTNNTNNGNINNGSINNGIVNNNNNLIIQFGKEDVNKLTMEEISKIINAGYSQTIQEAIKQIHYNPRLPQYHNVYLNSKNDLHALVFDGNEFKLTNLEETVDDLYDNNSAYVENLTETNNNKINKKKLEEVNKLLKDLIESDDKTINKIANQIKKDIKKIIYENKELPINRQKLLEKDEDNLDDNYNEDITTQTNVITI